MTLHPAPDEAAHAAAPAAAVPAVPTVPAGSTAGPAAAAGSGAARQGAQPAGGDRRVLGAVAAVVAVQALLLLVFAWPAVETAPRGVPLAVAGPPAAVAQLTQRVEATRPGAFAFTTVADAAAAEAAIGDRRVYGALVAGPQGLTVLTAPAASPAVAQLLAQLGQAAGAGGQVVRVVEVVPADPDDPRGAALTAGVLPLVMTSLLVGVLLTLRARAAWLRVAGVLLYGLLAGAAATAVLQYGLAALPGSYLANAAAVGLLATAMAGAIAGLGALLGRVGLGLGAATVFLLGNPLSGLASAPEMLPRPWGEIGQHLPPGAGGSLVRSVAFFDGTGAGRPAAVLAVWAVAGLALVGAAALRRRRAAPA
jgi:hypothetical protein